MTAYGGLLLVMLIDLLLLGGQASQQCEEKQEDFAIIKGIVEDHIINDYNTILKLSGIFYADQQKPPNTVKAIYKLQFPYNTECESLCSCWRSECSQAECEPDHCCIERQFIWGRIPNYAQDSVFRELTMCNLIIGGVKEKTVIINLNISSNSSIMQLSQCGVQSTPSGMPCSWCYSENKLLSGSILSSKYGLDTLLSVSTSVTPLEKALMSITAKLQGYAAKLEHIEWLQYSSDIAFGYAAPYKVSFESIARWAMFLMFYSSFQLIIFMLVYKYRYRIYNKVCGYVSQNPINKSLFWSFILTTILAFSCVFVLSLVADGICISMLQVIMIVESLAFGIPHSLVSCFRMKKSSGSIVTPQSFCLHKAIPSLLFSYIYTLPHIAFYWAINVMVYIIAKPFSYIVLSVYFCVSCMFIWVANAIGIQLLFPLRPCFSNRRQFFAITFLIGCNSLNFITWGFIEVYFYDRRAQTTSIITILPGLLFTILGYYLSGDLVKLFDMVVGTLPATKHDDDHPPPKADINDTKSTVHSPHTEARHSSYHDENSTLSKSDSGLLRVESAEIDDNKALTTTHKLTRLRHMVDIIQRPTSVMDLSSWNTNSTSRREGYLEIPQEEEK